MHRCSFDRIRRWTACRRTSSATGTARATRREVAAHSSLSAAAGSFNLRRGLALAGARARLWDRLDLAAAAFVLDLGGGIVWVGDEGTTEARGPTRRAGVEGEARWRILPWMWADLDATLSRAVFTEQPGNADAVALAPTRVVSGGLSARHPRGWIGRAGALHLGDRPATEDRFLSAEGFTRLDATVGWHGRRVEVAVEGRNLLDAA